MSRPRLVRREAEMFAHCFSRVVDKQFIFGEREKRYFHLWMRRLEEFSGVQVVTYCLMSNHFHLLLRVPDKSRMTALTESRLRALLSLIQQGTTLRDSLEELDRAALAAANGDSVWLKQIIARYDARRFNMSAFVGELKQRFSQWYNRRNDRQGTLWESRFKSVLVEGAEQALLTMAAYIDLNPLRAGLVPDPKDYHWCGYAEAVAGKVPARRGLCAILRHTTFGVNRCVTWATTAPRYRTLLFLHGEERPTDTVREIAGKRGLSQSAVEAELAKGGELSVGQVIRHRLRYFSDGAVFGSAEFVDQIFRENRSQFGQNRKSGARRMRGADWGDLRVARDLQKDVSR